MTKDEKQEFIDRVMSFVWTKGVQTTPIQHLCPTANLNVIWNPIFKSLRCDVRVSSPSKGVAFVDFTILKITFGGGRVWRREDLAIKALQELRRVMILDDLASI